MDLQKAIEEKTGELISSGKIEKMIEAQIEGTVKSIISDTLRDYSDFGKALKDKVSESLSLDLGKISFPEYQGVLMGFIVDQLDTMLLTDGKEKMKEMISKYFEPLEEKEYSLQDIARAFQQELKEDKNHYDDDTCTIIHKNERDDYHELYFDKSDNKPQYQCAYHIRINEKGIWSLEIYESNMSKYKGEVLFGFDRFLYQLYTTGTKIKCDSFDPEEYTYIGEEY